MTHGSRFVLFFADHVELMHPNHDSRKIPKPLLIETPLKATSMEIDITGGHSDRDSLVIGSGNGH